MASTYLSLGLGDSIGGRPVSGAAPNDTNVIAWSAANGRWEPTAAGGAPSGAAGGSLGGTYPNPTVVQLDGSGGVAQGPTTALKIGSTVASAGALRLGNAMGLYFRNAANSADVIGCYLDSGDLLYVGNGNQAGIRFYQGTTIPILLNSSGWQWNAGAASANVVFTQLSRASDAACADTTMSAQSPFASATGSNRKPGDLYLQVGTPTNGGTTHGRVVLKAGGTEVAVADKDSGGNARLRLNLSTQTTVGAAGGASALPATPTGYCKINIGGTDYVVPYYAVS